MTIRNLKSYTEALWDWGFLNSCFGGTKIRVSDVDGVVERKGKFLFIEAKRPNASIPGGQQRLFRALAKSGCSIFLIWGDQNKPERLSVWYPGRDNPEKPKPANQEAVADMVRRWFKYADKN